jgi:putative addiction module CopG family antidote
MPIEQMNISLSPQMARFIRGKVKKGEYTNASEVVRDAVRHLQAAETAKSERAMLADFEAHLSESEREDISRSVQRGIEDIEAGRFEEHDADSLPGLARQLVARSARKQTARAKTD